MKVYADSSFLVSLYSLDARSARAAAEVRRSRAEIMMTPLLELELSNALELRVFRDESSSAEVREARLELQAHVNDGVYGITSMPAMVFDLARRIALKRTATAGTRTLDILHVASAVLLRAEKFWTFDQSQARIAKAEGLQLL